MYPLEKYRESNEVQIRGMIAYTQRSYPFLEFTSVDVLHGLSSLMIHTHFMFESRATPIAASFEFLNKITEPASGKAGVQLFSGRDFVFVVKMFGLKMRSRNGVHQFVSSDEFDDAEDEEILISNAKEARQLEFYVSEVHKRTKIQTNAIQSALNRLLRDYREVELAKVFCDKMQNEAFTIGTAREYLRLHCGVKDHEFVRIRAHAIELGMFQSRRHHSKINRRVTLDEDVVPYVEGLTQTLAVKKPLTPSQAVNQALRDLCKLTTGESLEKS